jgi:hypothetical protein
MSSVTSFIKQVPSSAQYFSAAGLLPSTTYQLVPTSSNVVGNYPPGYVQTLTDGGVSLPTLTNAVYRDMGKTIFAGIGATASAFGWFRQVQIMIPQAITASQGFIGGSNTNAVSFGVIGTSTTPSSLTDYFTVYIPVVVGGISAVPGAAGQAVLGGNML